MAGKALLAVQYERQYAEAIDKDYKFTTVQRMDYLTNPLRYSGQIVLDTDEDELYRLNFARTAWLPITSATVPQIEELREELTSSTISYLTKFYYRDVVGIHNITVINNAIRDAKGVMFDLEVGTELTFASNLNVQILSPQDITKQSVALLVCVDKTIPLFTASFTSVSVAANHSSFDVKPTPAAPSFTSFDDVNNTVILVPVSGIPVTDYRYTLTNDATIYTVASSGLISVGDISTTVTAYSISTTDRNQSPNATIIFNATIITPAAPSNGIVDDEVNEFKANIVPGYTNLSDYEIEIIEN